MLKKLQQSSVCDDINNLVKLFPTYLVIFIIIKTEKLALK